MTDEEDTKNCSTGRVCILVLLFACVVVAIALGVYFGTRQEKKEKLALPKLKLDCLPIHKPSQQTSELCAERSCIWRESAPTDGSPRCVLPQSQASGAQSLVGYRLKGQPQKTARGWRFQLRKSETAVFVGSAIRDITLDVERETTTRVRLKFYDSANKRFEVPDEALHIEPDRVAPEENKAHYDIEWSDSAGYFGIAIKRNGSNTAIFDTRTAGMVFEDRFLQLTTLLPSDGVYGLGEHNHRQLRHNMNYKRWAIFTRDVAPVDEWNLYGAQPFYMNLEKDGKASGVLIKNSNAMDIITIPDPAALQFRIIGGVLDFYVFVGPTPTQVVQQYTQAVGRPVLPPYWSLGFQLSQWDYDNLTHVEAVMERNRNAGIPQDTQVIDIDYMDQFYIFTTDKQKYKNFAQFTKNIHNNGQRMYVIMDPGIGDNDTIVSGMGGYPPRKDGIENDVFVKAPDYQNRTYLQNRVWPGLTLMPDYTNPNTTKWWKRWIEDFYHKQGIEFDAIWIDMNEPASFVPGSTATPPCEHNDLNIPRYVPNILEDGKEKLGRLYTKTLCMDAKQHWGVHYNVHSLYGHSMAISTHKAMTELWPDKRPLVLTRSTFAGTGKYAVHWLGDNQSQWRQMPWSIVSLLEFSMFGFGFVGADICGFWFNTTAEMCTRWSQLGAFYPFARNHNGKGMNPQDPAAFGPEVVRAAREVLMTRYRLLPFLYTLLYRANEYGETVSTPMFFEFPTDSETWTVDRQFLWGPALLITPVLDQGKRSVDGYFPKGSWFDYYSGEEIQGPARLNLDTPLDRINLHLRAGYIIPVQEPAMTTTLSRKKPMGLIASLGPQGAEGFLYWDDGISSEAEVKANHTKLHFIATRRTLRSEVAHDTYAEASQLQFTEVTLHGLDGVPSAVQINGNPLDRGHIQTWPTAKSVTLHINHTITTPLNVEWSYL